MYGLSEETFYAMLEAQGGACAICKNAKFGSIGPCVDHDHKTGEVRGILCSRCNSAIAALGDSAEGLRRALAYLEARS